jgi:hypothetical protein
MSASSPKANVHTVIFRSELASLVDRSADRRVLGVDLGGRRIIKQQDVARPARSGHRRRFSEHPRRLLQRQSDVRPAPVFDDADSSDGIERGAGRSDWRSHTRGPGVGQDADAILSRSELRDQKSRRQEFGMDDGVVGVRRPSSVEASPSSAVLRPAPGGTDGAVSIDVHSGCEQRAVRKIDRDHDVRCVQLGGDSPAHFDHRRGQPHELPGCGRIELQREQF